MSCNRPHESGNDVPQLICQFGWGGVGVLGVLGGSCRVGGYLSQFERFSYKFHNSDVLNGYYWVVIDPMSPVMMSHNLFVNLVGGGVGVLGVLGGSCRVGGYLSQFERFSHKFHNSDVLNGY